MIGLFKIGDRHKNDGHVKPGSNTLGARNTVGVILLIPLDKKLILRSHEVQRLLIPDESQLDVTIPLKTNKVSPGFLSRVMVLAGNKLLSSQYPPLNSTELHSIHD